MGASGALSKLPSLRASWFLVLRSQQWLTLPIVLQHEDNEPWADPDDAPGLTEEFFEQADLYYGNKLIRAGRPPSENPKVALKLRIDPDIVDYFRATGMGQRGSGGRAVHLAINHLVAPRSQEVQLAARAIALKSRWGEPCAVFAIKKFGEWNF